MELLQGSLIWLLYSMTAPFFLKAFCYPPPHYSFLLEATSAPVVSYHDYIVVGGGTAGCALAATLSASATVLVLERGGSPYDNPNIRNTQGFATNLADNSPTSPSQPFVSEDGVYNTRARVLGGGTAINGGLYSRATKAEIAQWDWDKKMVEEAYSWVEEKIVSKPVVKQWQSALAKGLLEAGVAPYNGFTYEDNNGTTFAGTIFDSNSQRHTAADLLEHANPESITVYVHATVHRILFKTRGKTKPRAHRVIFKDQFGINHAGILNRGANSEVILSAGAIGSTQMLMLSGIGPKRQLVAHGIQVILHQPMVGRIMKDNPMNAMYVPSPTEVELSLPRTVGVTSSSYIQGMSGLFINPMATQSFAITEIEEALGVDNSHAQLNIQGGLITEKVIRPLSWGSLKLRNRNPDDTPSVTFNYFKHPGDLRKCVEGMEIVKKVVMSESMSRFRYGDVTTEILQGDMLAMPLNMRRRHSGAGVSLERFCLDTVMTFWNYHGGCQVGEVVDWDYRVMRVDALRVIDGSTFNTSPGTDPQATVMMLGRYMGKRILNERFGNKTEETP